MAVRLDDISWSGCQLFILYSVNGTRFSNTLWFEDVDLTALGGRWGHAAVRNLYFHIAAFELNKLCSLKPDTVDWGDYADLATPAFQALWQAVFRGVWAQWRYQNDLPDYPGPDIRPADAASSPEPIERTLAQTRYLCFFAGGKDSLVAAKLLEEAGVAFDSLTYATSFYGTMGSQFELVDSLRPWIAPRRHWRQWLFDDFLDSPVLALANPNRVKTLTAAETPSSVFGVLPLVLQEGISHVVLAHERSADKGQMLWAATGEEVNHQWGKSRAAEQLINDYVRTHLLAGFSYFSVLKPVYDVAIFHALRRYPEAASRTHSCNVRKPWCLSCPKCLYVWLGFAAFVEPEVVVRTFGAANPLDVAGNVHTFRQLVGLEDQLPFECIGEAEEAALFMLLAVRRGYDGPAVPACRPALDDLDVPGTVDRYLHVDAQATGVPPGPGEALLGWLHGNAAEARQFIASQLGSTQRR